MRYYRITITELAGLWGDTCTFWFEVSVDGDANRQLQTFPNGYILSYDADHPVDAYDGLQQMVVDGDAEWWEPYEITPEAFAAEWGMHLPVNRPWLPTPHTIPVLGELRPRFAPAPSMAEDQPPPF
jgi:hypothetical protein